MSNWWSAEPRRKSPPRDSLLVSDDFGDARYRAGWWIATDDGTGERRPEAYLMPRSNDWIDIYPAGSWWEAMAKAIDLTASTPDCFYAGGDHAVHG